MAMLSRSAPAQATRTFALPLAGAQTSVSAAATLTGTQTMTGATSRLASATLTGAQTMPAAGSILGTATLTGGEALVGAGSILGTATLTGAQTMSGAATLLGSVGLTGLLTLAGIGAAVTVTGATFIGTHTMFGTSAPTASGPQVWVGSFVNVLRGDARVVRVGSTETRLVPMHVKMNGISINPTSDPIMYAIVPSGSPQPTSFFPATWETWTAPYKTRYFASILLPSLPRGQWDVWIWHSRNQTSTNVACPQPLFVF